MPNVSYAINHYWWLNYDPIRCHAWLKKHLQLTVVVGSCGRVIWRVQQKRFHALKLSPIKALPNAFQRKFPLCMPKRSCCLCPFKMKPCLWKNIVKHSSTCAPISFQVGPSFKNTSCRCFLEVISISVFKKRTWDAFNRLVQQKPINFRRPVRASIF